MKYLYLIIVVFVSGCSSLSKKETNTMDLIEEVSLVAQKANLVNQKDKGVEGEFVFIIKAAGQQRNRVFLNTQLDYRDRRNITLALSKKVSKYIKKAHSQSPLDFFINKQVLVKGIANRVKIWFFSKGIRTEKYYYQIHININDPEQIKVIE